MGGSGDATDGSKGGDEIEPAPEPAEPSISIGQFGAFAGDLLDALENRFKTEINTYDFKEILTSFWSEHLHRDITVSEIEGAMGWYN